MFLGVGGNSLSPGPHPHIIHTRLEWYPVHQTWLRTGRASHARSRARIGTQ